MSQAKVWMERDPEQIRLMSYAYNRLTLNRRVYSSDVDIFECSWPVWRKKNCFVRRSPVVLTLIEWAHLFPCIILSDDRNNMSLRKRVFIGEDHMNYLDSMSNEDNTWTDEIQPKTLKIPWNQCPSQHKEAPYRTYLFSTIRTLRHIKNTWDTLKKHEEDLSGLAPERILREWAGGSFILSGISLFFLLFRLLFFWGSSTPGKVTRWLVL
jgi:hypothetical protein